MPDAGGGPTWPDGTWFWHVSRVCGVTAYIAVWLSVVAGLSLSTSLGDRVLGRARALEVHRALSSAGLWLTLGHVLALLGDRWIGFRPIELLVPFVGPYRPLATGLGGVAAWLALLVHASGWAKRWIGPRVWRGVHFLSFAVYVLVVVHGAAAGTDARAGWMQALWWLSTISVAWLIAYRVLAALGTRRRAGSEVASRPG